MPTLHLLMVLFTVVLPAGASPGKAETMAAAEMMKTASLENMMRVLEGEVCFVERTTGRLNVSGRLKKKMR